MPNLQLYSKKLDLYHDPELIFCNIYGQSNPAFWLDSNELSRFSFMGDGQGANSFLVEHHTQAQSENIFDYLKSEIAKRSCNSETIPFDFNGGFVGYLGYELKAECGSKLLHRSPLPDALLLFADRFLAIDHLEKVIYLVCLVGQDQQNQAEFWFEQIIKQMENLCPIPEIVSQSSLEEPVTFHLSRSYQNYISDIEQCLKEIYKGESYQVCLTNQIKTQVRPDPMRFYLNLRRSNPAPYAAYLRFGEIAVICSSPESFLKIDRNNWAQSKPIKGTIKRGETNLQDQILRESLRNSEKDRAENLMIVDLLRNDLGRVCEIGTVQVPKLMDIETYATVHQMVSTVRGRLRAGLDVTDCLKAVWPGGSMTGAPKLRTMEIIDCLEQECRGIYSGSIGYLALNGTCDLNIVIRTAVITPEGTSIGVGGGIVAMSQAESEYQETLLKAQALIEALVVTVKGTFDEDQYQILTQGLNNSQF